MLNVLKLWVRCVCNNIGWGVVRCLFILDIDYVVWVLLVYFEEMWDVCCVGWIIVVKIVDKYWKWIGGWYFMFGVGFLVDVVGLIV